MSDFHANYKLQLTAASEMLFGSPAAASPPETAAVPVPGAGAPRGWWRALTVGALASIAALLTALLTLTASTSPPAYALVVNSNGTLTLTINELVGVDGANAQLARLGVRARIAKVEPTCEQRGHFIRVRWPRRGAPPVEPERLHSGLSGLRVIIHPREIPPQDTMLLTARLGHTAYHGAAMQTLEMSIGLYRGPAPTCSS